MIITEIRQRPSGLTEAQFTAPVRVQTPEVKIGAVDWFVGPFAPRPKSRYETNPQVIDKVAELGGYDSVMVSIGQRTREGNLLLDNVDLQNQYRDGVNRTGIIIPGVCLDDFDLQKPYESDESLKRAQESIVDGIKVAHAMKDLGVTSLRIPLFAPDNMLTATRLDKAAGMLHDIAPEAERAGIVLGLEETLPTRAKIDFIEKVGSDNVLIDLDSGNEYKEGREPAVVAAHLARAGVINVVDLKHNSTRKDATGKSVVRPQYLNDTSRYSVKDVVQSLAENGYRSWDGDRFYIEALGPEDTDPHVPWTQERQARTDKDNKVNYHYAQEIVLAVFASHNQV